MIDASDLSRKDARISIKLLTPQDTENLGRDFAPCLHMDWENASVHSKRTRVALIATPGTGKTSFFKGLYSTLDKPLTIERRQDFLIHSRFAGKSITQKWFQSVEMGHVCHVDVGFGSQFWRILKPYRDKLLDAQNLGGVDIVENAQTDERKDEFDCAVWIEKSMDQDMNPYREAYIIASDKFAARPAFQTFIETHAPRAEI